MPIILSESLNRHVLSNLVVSHLKEYRERKNYRHSEISVQSLGKFSELMQIDSIVQFQHWRIFHHFACKMLLTASWIGSMRFLSSYLIDFLSRGDIKTWDNRVGNIMELFPVTNRRISHKIILYCIISEIKYAFKNMFYIAYIVWDVSLNCVKYRISHLKNQSFNAYFITSIYFDLRYYVRIYLQKWCHLCLCWLIFPLLNN